MFIESIIIAVALTQSQQPNIVVFLVDDLGWQDTSVPFHTEVTPFNERYNTPNWQRLADHGELELARWPVDHGRHDG